MLSSTGTWDEIINPTQLTLFRVHLAKPSFICSRVILACQYITTGMNPKEVSRFVDHAIDNRKPKLRYTVIRTDSTPRFPTAACFAPSTWRTSANTSGGRSKALLGTHDQ